MKEKLIEMTEVIYMLYADCKNCTDSNGVCTGHYEWTGKKVIIKGETYYPHMCSGCMKQQDLKRIYPATHRSSILK